MPILERVCPVCKQKFEGHGNQKLCKKSSCHRIWGSFNQRKHGLNPPTLKEIVNSTEYDYVMMVVDTPRGKRWVWVKKQDKSGD